MTSVDDSAATKEKGHIYTPLRIGDVPALDIAFVDSKEMAVGRGEPASTVAGPAIGHAIYNAVGVRLRHIPITPQAVKTVIAKPW